MDERFPQITSRIDTEQLRKIKNQFSLRERVNSDRFELDQAERKSPTLIFSDVNVNPALSDSALKGLKYPLEVDGKGGLALSSNYDRVGQQILEVLQTRIGERVYRPFFGLPELLFETIDEYSLAQTIRSQLNTSIPLSIDLDVKVRLEEDGGATIVVFYSVEGSEPSIVRYAFTP